MSWLLTRNKDGVFLEAIAAGHGGMRIDPPLLLVPQTVTEGTSWKSRRTLRSIDGSAPAPGPGVTFSLESSTISEQIHATGKAYNARQVELGMFFGGNTPALQQVAPMMKISQDRAPRGRM